MFKSLTLTVTGNAFETRSHITEPSRVYTTQMTNSQGPSSYYSRSEAYSRRPREPSEDGSSVVYDHGELSLCLFFS